MTMKQISKSCAIAASCPAVYDPEDGSGRLLIVGSGAYHDGEAGGIKIGPGETALWIDRKLVEDALKSQSS
jgi:hypothetical protein